MAKDKSKKAVIKKLYIEDGLGDSEIATRLNINRGTVSYHKKKDKDLGIDWDEIRSNKNYNNLTSSENFEKNQQQFLTTLFNAFENEKNSIEQIEDPKARLEKLNSFATNYFKLKRPAVNDCKGVADKASRLVLDTIIDFCDEQNKNDFIDFLNEHFEDIVVKTVEKVKKSK
ncbi:DUF1804 family protein [Aliarcobacter vitoriensis]|uniref:Uncharacterized protein n=1 Tax=Aliarcobacter vitoriensis TaxID=2011099 RepID=A0A366MQ95_9BACT|nr:DUF1804 family protein [Aliarcobacter vitoriensis]RBQ28405.1 hypothetical protein CRU91_09295 [Aliarcobacter vitoriensis]